MLSTPASEAIDHPWIPFNSECQRAWVGSLAANRLGRSAAAGDERIALVRREPPAEMLVRNSSHRHRFGGVLAACAAATLLSASAAWAQDEWHEPPAPGNLIANWGFDTDTSGW